MNDLCNSPVAGKQKTPKGHELYWLLLRPVDEDETLELSGDELLENLISIGYRTGELGYCYAVYEDAPPWTSHYFRLVDWLKWHKETDGFLNFETEECQMFVSLEGSIYVGHKKKLVERFEELTTEEHRDVLERKLLEAEDIARKSSSLEHSPVASMVDEDEDEDEDGEEDGFNVIFV
ncbi:hypothetical protein FGADI_7416 [Fusarium gaditjirri]|uniref:Uncharacterized protein n=1 Tax=Fusarium gaditjirri TaxID=282569 RepID=A0A8H4T536_9HYPO|nr:hypothetical protein FGADI_7416 [Fusarium gaditjirri]